ncbi:hypothetical protein C8Q80DRAFT_774843 [Daedaleopsis nitida]|nr:hypothetical protein C8Q80DRAFT_774843 [Daedaleopsis nitida]
MHARPPTSDVCGSGRTVSSTTLLRCTSSSGVCTAGGERSGRRFVSAPRELAAKYWQAKRPRRGPNTVRHDRERASERHAGWSSRVERAVRPASVCAMRTHKLAARTARTSLANQRISGPITLSRYYIWARAPRICGGSSSCSLVHLSAIGVADCALRCCGLLPESPWTHIHRSFGDSLDRSYRTPLSAGVDERRCRLLDKPTRCSAIGFVAAQPALELLSSPDPMDLPSRPMHMHMCATKPPRLPLRPAVNPAARRPVASQGQPRAHAPNSTLPASCGDTDARIAGLSSRPGDGDHSTIPGCSLQCTVPQGPRAPWPVVARARARALE